MLLRLLAYAVAAYAFSPVDLIPDFIPVLGLLDDLLLIPAGLALVLYLCPEPVVTAARKRAATAAMRPISRPAAVVVVLIWALLAWLTWRWFADALLVAGPGQGALQYR